MFKADGSEVRNPGAFVAKISKYEGGLFTADGAEIRNPSRFVARLQQRGSSEAKSAKSRAPRQPDRRSAAGGRQGDAVLYKANGEPIWNPEAFIGKITSYDGGLFTADWEEVRNPKAFLAGLSRSSTRAGGRGEAESVLYKADGTPIWNARKFVDKIANYNGGLYTASGQEVWNPQAFVEGVEKRGGARPSAQEEVLVYKSNGDPIWNLSRFVEKIQEYSGGLYTADGQEIRNPKAFVAGLERRGAPEKRAPAARRGAKGSGKGPKGGQDKAPLYKADGTPIWNPEAFVAKIYDYDGGLFTSDWQEVRNPQAFVAGLVGKDAGRGRRA